VLPTADGAKETEGRQNVLRKGGRELGMEEAKDINLAILFAS
jgi:hypothetical protein